MLTFNFVQNCFSYWKIIVGRNTTMVVDAGMPQDSILGPML